MDGDDGLGDLGGFDDVTVEATVDDAPAPTGEDVVDAEFVVIAPDGTVLSGETGLEVATPTVTVTEVDGEPVDDGLPDLPTLDDPHGSDGARPSGGSGAFVDGSQHGQPKFPGAGGGSTKKGPGTWRRKKGPKAAGATFDGGSGGGGSLIGSLISVNVGATANVANGASIASPNIAPAVGGIAATGNPATGRSGSARRPTSTGRRRPTHFS